MSAPTSGAVELLVGPDPEDGPSAGRGERLDKLIAQALDARGMAVSRARLAKAFSAGEVCDAAGGRLKPSLRLDRQLAVHVRVPQPEPLGVEPEDLPLEVLFEDEHLLVIDKPAHMAVHPGPGHARGTLVNAVVHHLGAQAASLPVLPGNEAYRPGLVHRLDRDTSGVMVLAKHARAMEGLAAQFRVHDIERVYLGVVAGVPRQLAPGEALRIVTGHGRDPADRRRFAPVDDGPGETGRQAISVVRLERAFSHAAVLSFRLETGRTHQIRMHARHLGHPILGDELYGAKVRPPWLAEAVRAMGRQALHAAVLGFQHPATNRRMRFEAPLPGAIGKLVQGLIAASG